MINFKEFYVLQEADGQKAGQFEIVSTDTKTANKYANSVIDNLDVQIPNFDKNYEFARSKAKKGSTQRQDMPVIRTAQVKLLQQRLKSGDLDIHKPFYKSNENPFPMGLTADMATDWLTHGLKDGDLKDDIIKVSTKKVSIDKLNPIQKQIYLSNSLNMLTFKGQSVEKNVEFLSSTSFIVSSDHYILDGHHRYLAGILADSKLKVNVLMIDLPIEKLLPLLIAYGDAIGNKRNK